MRLVQIQVHRGDAENAEEYSYDPIGRRRLDHKLSPFGNRFRLYLTAIGLQEMPVLTRKRAFYLAASHRQIKKHFSASSASLR